MFSSKPVRTTDPVLLRQKAIEFLDKNYTRVKPGQPLPTTFYMLEPRSINGMTKIEMLPNFTNTIVFGHKYTSKNATSIFTNLSDGETHQPMNVIKNVDLDDVNNPVWTRTISMFGNSASDAVLGGTRRRQRKSRRNRRRQRKTSRR
jgi:hypothetical protein